MPDKVVTYGDVRREIAKALAEETDPLKRLKIKADTFWIRFCAAKDSDPFQILPHK